MSTSTAVDYTARLDRAQQTLQHRGIDALVLGPSADLLYLTGFNAHASERMNLLILPARGNPSFVVPRLEAPLLGKAAEHLQLVPWADDENPAALAGERLRSIDAGRVAVGNQLYAAFLLRIMAHADAAEWIEADGVMRQLRMYKDPFEIDALSEAARLTDEAWETFIMSGPISGLTELQALQRLLDISADKGLDGPHGIVGSGPNSASPHHGGNDRVIQPGDAVVFDWGGRVNGYLSDVTRCAHVGEPDDDYRTVYDIVRRANDAMLAAVRPGVQAQQLDAAARRLIADAGYGDAFVHRVGHGLGLEVHEEPYLVAGNTLEIEPGMTFSDEPGIYVEGRFGVRIEDTVLCTEGGGRRLNNATRDLIVLE